MKYKKIINSNKEDLEKKYPWLKDADFRNAIICDKGPYITWENGTWKGGTWKDGIWKDGIWEGGQMWNNLDQEYQEVTQKENNKFFKLNK